MDIAISRGEYWMSAGTYSDWLTALGRNESGNNYAFTSSLGYLGRFQFGEEALKAIGFYSGDDGTGAIDFIGSWTSKAASYGVFDKMTFLQSPAAQDAAAHDWFAKIEDDLNSLGLGKYQGQTIGGTPITASGMIAGAHLVGVWALKSFLDSAGGIDTRDGYGTPVSEYIHRFGGYDTPFGGPVPVSGGVGETHIGGSGDDTITAGDGANYLRGGDGADKITGGAGFDDINGNKGNDTVDGGSGGNDWLLGGQGNDLVTAQSGNNLIYGNLGDDTLVGGSGNDTIRGGQGDDSIVAGSGAQWISGDRGNDTIQAGSGPDTFHTFAQAGIDKVLAFNEAKGDHVEVDGGATYTFSQVGADTVVDMGGGNEMILVGVQLSGLHPGWIFGA
jgi:serralysin